MEEQRNDLTETLKRSGDPTLDEAETVMKKQKSLQYATLLGATGDCPDIDPAVLSRFVIIGTPADCADCPKLTFATRCKSTETYLSKTVENMAKHPDCLTTAYDEDCDDAHWKFCAALAQAFDLDPLIIAQLHNYDFLRSPEGHSREDEALPNCVQILTLCGQTPDPIQETLSFLATHCEPNDEEPYEHTEYDRRRIHAALQRILAEHGNAAAYFRFVSRRLWRAEDFLAKTYAWYMERLQKRLDACSQGLPCVFSRMDDQTGKPLYTPL